MSIYSVPCVHMAWRLRGNQKWRLLASYWGFPGGLVVKNPPANAGNAGSIPGLGRSPGGGNGNALQYSCLENPHEQWSLECCSSGSCKELDSTEDPCTQPLMDFFFFFFGYTAYRILVPQPEIEPALEVWRLNHWATGEVPLLRIVKLH